MKELYKEMCKEIGPCLLEILVFTVMYYLLIRGTHFESRPGMNVIIPATCVCIVIANIIIHLKTDVLIEYLGKWAMISFVFAFILTGAILFGCAPHASMRLIFVLSSTFGLVIVGYNKIFSTLFKNGVKDDEAINKKQR